MSEKQPTAQCPHCGYPVEIGEHASDCPNSPEKTVPSSEDVQTIGTQKGPQELEQQFRFAEASRMMDYDEDVDKTPIPEPPEQIYHLSADELKDRMKSDSDLQEQYQTFLGALRKLRKNEHNAYKYRGHGSKGDSHPLPFEYGIPTGLMERILSRMQGSGGLSERFFTDAARDQASGDVESFYSLIRNTLQERPDAFLMNSKELRGIFHDDEIRNIAQKAAERDPRLFLFYLDKYDSLFDDHELNELVVNAAAQSPYSIDNLFKKDSVRARLTPETLKHCAEMVSDHELFENINQLVSEGVFTREQAMDAFLQRIDRALVPSEVVAHYCALFTTEADKERLRQALSKLTQEENIHYHFSDPEKTLNQYASVLGEGWKAETVKRMAQYAPDDLLDQPELVAEYFGEHGMEDILERCVTTLEKNFSPMFSEEVLRHKLITPEQRERVSRIIIRESPYEALRNSHIVLDVIPEEERPQLIKRLMTEYPESIVYGRRHFDQMSHMSGEEKREFGRGLLAEARDFRFLETYRSQTEDGNFLRELVSEDELMDFLLRKAEMNPQHALMELDKIRQVLGTEEDLVKFVEKLSYLVPHQVLDYFPNFSYLFNEDEARLFLERVIGMDEEAALDYFHKWSKAVSPDWAKMKLKQLVDKHPSEALVSADRIIGYIDEKDRPGLIRSWIKINPFVGYEMADQIRRFVPEISQEKIMEDAANDTERIQFAPKTISNIFKRLERAKTPEQKTTLLAKGYRLYKSIGTLHSEGLQDDYEKIFAAENPSESDEERLLEDAYSFALLKRMKQESTESTLPETWAQLREQLGVEISNQLTAPDLSPSEQQKAIESFGGGSPILLYITKHRDNPEIMSLMKEAFQQAGLGTYHEWRFEKNRLLEDIKMEGHVPEALTDSQFDTWSQDQKTDLAASLETSSTDVAIAIKSILQANIQELGSEALAAGDPETITAEIKEEIKKIGQELSALGKQKSRAEGAEREEINIKIDELKRFQDQLSAERDMVRLSLLKAEEIAQGYLLEGKEGKRSQKLSKFIRSLKERFPAAESVFITIEKTLQELGTGDQAAQNLVAEDSSDLETCFKIGSDPVKSCQDYNSGGYNEALMAYISEPNTKATIVRNEKGNAIGRRITRMLSLPGGEPALFLETKYASTASGAVDLVMLTHAVKKAEQMGMRIFIKEADAIPEGYTLIDTSEMLESKGGRAPYAYVDAAGGEKKRGKYRITGLKEIVRQGQ